MTKTNWHKSLRYFGLVLLLLVLPALTAAQRLPTGVVPDHYKLTLDPNIEQKKFSGEETIDVRVGQPTAEIVLNSLDLDISEAEVITPAGAQSAKITYDKPNERVRLAVPQQLHAGDAHVHIKYSGILTNGYPVRGHVRANDVPMLRRAGIQGHLRSRGRGRQW
jgi:aminopeptidase N/puromycin-sensitive aminopeptidase